MASTPFVLSLSEEACRRKCVEGSLSKGGGPRLPFGRPSTVARATPIAAAARQSCSRGLGLPRLDGQVA